MFLCVIICRGLKSRRHYGYVQTWITDRLNSHFKVENDCILMRSPKDVSPVIRSKDSAYMFGHSEYLIASHEVQCRFTAWPLQWEEEVVWLYLVTSRNRCWPLLRETISSNLAAKSPGTIICHLRVAFVSEWYFLYSICIGLERFIFLSHIEIF